MIKKLVRISGLKDIKEPSDFTTLHNDLIYYAEKSKVLYQISSDIYTDEDYNIFIGNRLVDVDNVYLLMSYNVGLSPLLKILDFKAESYESSLNLAKNKAMLRIFLHKFGIPVPRFTIGLPLDSGFPCLVKKKDYSDMEDMKIIKNEDELYYYIDNKDSPVVEEIIGLEKDIQLTYLVWTYFYKPVAIIAEIVRNYKEWEEAITPKKEVLYYIPIFPREIIKLDEFTTLRFKNLDSYRDSPAQDYLTVQETNKTLEAFSLEGVPFLYSASKNTVEYNHKRIKKWNVFTLAEATSQLLKLGFCRVDIKLDKKQNPYVINVKPYTGYYKKPFPFHIVNKFESKSQQIWYMLKEYYELFT